MNYKVLGTRQSPAKESPVQVKIEGFGKLDEGWDFGYGGPAPSHVVKMALAFFRFGERLAFEMDAFPGAAGDISVDYYVGDELVQVLVDTDLTIELTHERGIGSSYEELACYEDISIDKVLDYLVHFHLKGYSGSWSSSDFFTEKSTNRGLRDSIPTLSRNSTGRYPSSKWNAYATPVRKYANTLDGIIKPLPTENRLPFGSLPRAA
jgi:hypothetical protein